MEKINIIKKSILKNTPAKYIYLFGSYAYGKPTFKPINDLKNIIKNKDNNTKKDM